MTDGNTNEEKYNIKKMTKEPTKESIVRKVTWNRTHGRADLEVTALMTQTRTIRRTKGVLGRTLMGIT